MQPVSSRVRARRVRRGVNPRTRRARAGVALIVLIAAVFVIGGQTLASGQTTASSSATALAQFNRMTVSDTASSSDPHLQTAIVQGGQGGPGYIATLRSQHPGIRILLYKTNWWLRPSDAAGYASCLPGSGSYPESWYLHNSSGARETWNAGTSQMQYAMDFGNTGYAGACAQKLAADVKANGADGVFLDGAPTSLYWAQIPSTCTAGTCANNIYQFSCGFTCDGSCAFDSRFSRDKIKFGEFSNVEWASTASVWLSKTGSIICPVNTNFPKSRICYPAYSIRRDDPIGPSR